MATSFTMESMFSLDSILPLQNQVSFILGESGSGKTVFIKQIIQSLTDTIGLQIFCQDADEWNGFHNVSRENPFARLELIDALPENTLIIVDDYFHSQKADINENFSSVIHYKLRHKRLTLFCLIHTIFKSHIYSYFMLCNNFFFTYSKITKKILLQFSLQYGVNFRDVFEQHYTEGQSGFHIAYLNLKNIYFIPEINLLLSGGHFPIKMFKTEEEYFIFPKSELEIKENKGGASSEESSPSTETLEKLLELGREIYPKKNTKILVLLKTLFLHVQKYVNTDTYCIETEDFQVNFFDLLRYLNAPNIKKPIYDRDLTKLLQFLRSLKIKLPKLLIKNKGAYKYLC